MSLAPGDLVAVELPPTWRPVSGTSEVEATIARVIGLMRGDSPGSAVDAMLEADKLLCGVLATLQATPIVVELPDGSQLHRSPSDALREVAHRYFCEGVDFAREITSSGPGATDAAFDELWRKEKLP